MKNQAQIDHELAQNLEAGWWGNCANTLGEQLKQVIYAHQMGLVFQEIDGKPYQIDLEGKVVVDLGGGPESLLLKAINGKCIVVDPCEYPQWVAERYWFANVEYIKEKAENITLIPDFTNKLSCDIVLMYNVLQHTENPQKIIENAFLIGKEVRLFEWVDADQNHAHPHILTEEKLNEWLGGKGKVETFNGINGLYGKAYYGIFKKRTSQKDRFSEGLQAME